MSGARASFSYATFDQIRRYGQTFDGALAYSDCCDVASMTIAGAKTPVEILFVSGDFFQTLGVAALARTDARRPPTICRAAARRGRLP